MEGTESASILRYVVMKYGELAYVLETLTVLNIKNETELNSEFIASITDLTVWH